MKLKQGAGMRRTRATHHRIAALLGAALLSTLCAAQVWAVAVTPSAIYVDQRTRSATLTVYNPGTTPAEVEISFAFGYPWSDENGEVRVRIVHPDSVSAGDPSAAGWLRAFPRRLILEPGQRQTVRLMVQPPADLPVGEYWARVLVRARGGQPPIEQRSGDVTMMLNLETVVVTALTYRNGDVSTGISVGGARAELLPEGLRVSMDLHRGGSAAYLGRITLQVVSPEGRVVAEGSDNLAVYHAMHRRFSFPPDLEIPAGSTVRYAISATRPDLSTNAVLPAPPVSGSLPIRR
jgi:hypothetical protein